MAVQMARPAWHRAHGEERSAPDRMDGTATLARPPTAGRVGPWTLALSVVFVTQALKAIAARIDVEVGGKGAVVVSAVVAVILTGVHRFGGSAIATRHLEHE